MKVPIGYASSLPAQQIGWWGLCFYLKFWAKLIHSCPLKRRLPIDIRSYSLNVSLAKKSPITSRRRRVQRAYNMNGICVKTFSCKVVKHSLVYLIVHKLVRDVTYT